MPELTGAAPQKIPQPERLARRFDDAMPRDPFVREKFTKERTAARKLAVEYFERFPKERYQTGGRGLARTAIIEFTMKRLREPIEAGD